MSLYAAVPPIEALRLILHLAATNFDSTQKEYFKIMTNDVSRAYFYAPIQEGQNIYVKLPPEDILPGEEQMCGKLNFSMYGTRRAATNWQSHYTKVLVQNGFTTGIANNCTFYNETKKHAKMKKSMNIKSCVSDIDIYSGVLVSDQEVSPINY